MVPRKDMMQIIRRDTGFSAKLGFGAEAGDTSPETARSEVVHFTPGGSLVELGESREEGKEVATTPSAVPTKAGVRGAVVYVAVSLTAEQASRAEVWAQAARCSVSLLIRHVAQGLRDAICLDWASQGMPQVHEARGIRGKYPTSVTLTLPQDFAASLKAQHDPLGLIGLGRAMGPAFRCRFQAAFDDALIKANFSTNDIEGENH